MNETREIEFFWTVHHGKRWSFALSEANALTGLTFDAAYDDDPTGWSVERTAEFVSVARGELIEIDGELIELDDTGSVNSRKPRTLPHVFWYCLFCGERHNVDLFRDPLHGTSPWPNPSVWHCERGKGKVLIHW